jgi:F-type H+-transporting ATPase subunit delta
MSAANSYARALYEAAKDNRESSENLDLIEKQITGFISVLGTSKELRAALLAPITTTREKISIVEDLSKRLGITSFLQQFLVLLARKERLPLLAKICDSFAEVRLKAEGGVSGQLVAAEPMSESDISTLVKAFSQKLGKKVAFRVSTDPLLLAGMKVTVNGVTYDGTLRSQLQKLRDRFVAGLPGAHA